MKKIFLAFTSLIALTSIASAADLPARTYQAPQYVSPATNWSGFYIGAMGGYAWSNSVDINGFSFTGDDLQGGFFGGTIGYNWQTMGSQFVFGLEVDAAAASIRDRGFVGAFGAEDKIRSFGSVTGRLGYTVMQSALLYMKGGYAWADNRVSLFGPGFGISDSQLHSGWTIGAGAEWMFAPSWSAKIEYMYADYGRASYFTPLVGPGILDIGATTNSIKGGINYHFNWAHY
jgi:outer membrane immunogenic protein